MYDSYGYGQPMMQQMQMRQNDWQQRIQARNAPRYEVIQVNGENGARAFAMAPNSSAPSPCCRRPPARSPRP